MLLFFTTSLLPNYASRVFCALCRSDLQAVVCPFAPRSHNTQTSPSHHSEPCSAPLSPAALTSSAAVKATWPGKKSGKDSLRKHSYFSMEAETDQSSLRGRICLHFRSQLMLMIHTLFDLLSFSCLLF